MWKEEKNYPCLNDDKSGSICRMTYLLRRLKHSKRLEVYGSMTQENNQMRSWKE